MVVPILLADDHAVVRQGLRTLLENQPDMKVIGEADNGRDAVKMARELNPEVIILDVAMPDMNGIEAARQITAESPDSKIIALSMHSQKRFVSEMLRAGASAYLPKTCDFQEVIEAIHSVKGGKIYLSPRIANTIIDDYVNRLLAESAGAFSVLTPRERQVLQYVAEGHTTKDIAAMLHVSVKTVDAHRHNIMDKLNIHSIAELTKYAVREGLTFLET
jgi:DNA-binding NarL/FixJ family response regulator